MTRTTTTPRASVRFLRGRLRPAVRGMLHAARARECPCCGSTFAAFQGHRGRADALSTLRRAGALPPPLALLDRADEPVLRRVACPARRTVRI